MSFHLRLMIAVLLTVLCFRPALSKEPLPPDAVVIMEKDLNELQSFAQKCDAFASDCSNKNQLLLEYKKEADRLIEHQELRHTYVKRDLESERKNRWLWIVGGIAAGVLGGTMINK